MIYIFFYLKEIITIKNINNMLSCEYDLYNGMNDNKGKYHNKNSKKTKKRKTSPHPYTLEFSNLILTEMYNIIMKAITNSGERVIFLIRFPLLYGCIQPGFKCHRLELEDFIEYIRGYAIQTYCNTVSYPFQKTKLFKDKIRHFSQVKMRNILYAISNTHHECLGAFKIMCGHTVIWKETMFNMCKPFKSLKLNQHNNKVYLEADLITYRVFPPTSDQIFQEISKMERFIEEDNSIRYSFGIEKQLIR